MKILEKAKFCIAFWSMLIWSEKTLLQKPSSVRLADYLESYKNVLNGISISD